jgi:hypothetical protein
VRIMLLVAAIIMPLGVNAQTTTIHQDWSVSTFKDAMTDKVRTQAQTTNLQVKDRNEPFMLTVFCLDHALRVSLRTNGLWFSTMNYLISISARVDDSRATRSQWYLMQNGKSADIPSRPLVASLRSGSAVRFRVETSGDSYDAVFGLKGAATAIAEVDRACRKG